MDGWVLQLTDVGLALHLVSRSQFSQSGVFCRVGPALPVACARAQTCTCACAHICQKIALKLHEKHWSASLQKACITAFRIPCARRHPFSHCLHWHPRTPLQLAPPHALHLRVRQGTPDWLAPELMLQHHPATEKCDIWSLGIVLWEVVRGEQPTRRLLTPIRWAPTCCQALHASQCRPALGVRMSMQDCNLLGGCWRGWVWRVMLAFRARQRKLAGARMGHFACVCCQRQADVPVVRTAQAQSRLKACMGCRVPEECPPEVAELIDDCLQPDPKARPTAKEVVKRIQRIHLSSSPQPKPNSRNRCGSVREDVGVCAWGRGHLGWAWGGAAVRMAVHVPARRVNATPLMCEKGGGGRVCVGGMQRCKGTCMAACSLAYSYGNLRMGMSKFQQHHLARVLMPLHVHICKRLYTNTLRVHWIAFQRQLRLSSSCPPLWCSLCLVGDV